MYQEFYDRGELQMVFFPSSMRQERFHLFYITKSSFLKQLFPNRIGKTNFHRNITDLFVARWTTLNINISQHNIEHTATVTIHMGGHSFPYLNVKNLWVFFFEHTHASRAPALRLWHVHKPNGNSYNKKITTTNSTVFFFFFLFQKYRLYSCPVWRKRHHLYTMANLIASYI